MRGGWLLIPCRHAHGLLSERMDAPLATGDRLRLWLHLKICNACTQIGRQMEFMRTAMRRLSD